MNGTKKRWMGSFPGKQLQNKTVNAAEGGETLRQLKEML